MKKPATGSDDKEIGDGWVDEDEDGMDAVGDGAQLLSAGLEVKEKDASTTSVPDDDGADLVDEIT